MNDNQKGNALVGGATTEEVVESSETVLKGKGLQQFYAPPQLSKLVANVFGDGVSVLDPTAGDGSLLRDINPTRAFGVEIDRDQVRRREGRYNPLKGDFQHMLTLLRLGMTPWPAIAANPPFGLKWEAPSIRGGKQTNSTVFTFIAIHRLLAEDGQYAFVAGRNRFYRQVMETDDAGSVYAVIECDDLFEGTQEPCVIAFGIHPAIRSTGSVGFENRELALEHLDLAAPWVLEAREKAIDNYSYLSHRDHLSYVRVEQLQSIQDEYGKRLENRIKTREFDAQLFNGDHIQWFPSAFAKIALQKAGRGDDFRGLNGQPVTYFAQNERLWYALANLEDEGVLTVDPRLREAVGRVLGDIERTRIPLYHLKPQQRLGFLDDVDTLRCVLADPEKHLAAGVTYRLDTQTTDIPETETRLVESKKNPGEYEEQTFKKYRKVMKLTISGEGAHHTIYDGGAKASEEIAWLVKHFEIPDPGDISGRHPEEIERLEGIVQEVMDEFLANSKVWEEKNPHSMPYSHRPFQKQDIARLIFKGFGLNAWEQGLGKTVGGLMFAATAWKLGAKKKFLVVTAADLIPQWTRECERFLGVTPEVVKTHGQAHRIAKHLRLGGEGVYITNYEALAINGTLRKNKALPVVTVRTWEEQRLVKGTDRQTYYSWVKKEEYDSPTPSVEYGQDDLDHFFTEVIGLPAEWEDMKQSERRIAAEEQGWLQRPTKNYYLGTTTDKRACYGRVVARFETITKKLTSRDLCPKCEADERSGWNGLYCEAEDGAGVKCGYAHFAVRMKPIASLLSTSFHDGVIELDEITFIQGDLAKRSIALRGLQAKYRLGLSGTPIKNYVDQIFWPLAWCLGYGKPWFPYEYDEGRTRFENDFCVVEYRVNGRRQENRKVLPDVTNLSRFWRMLASCTIRRRAEETGEPIVDIFYHEVKVPLGLGQAEQTKEWLKKLPHGFPAFFAEKYPDKKVVMAGMHELMAPLLGLNWKLDYACTLPKADPDFEWTGLDVSDYTPGNLRALELTMALAKSGRKVLFGSHIVSEGKWIADRLVEKGVKAVHIVDDTGQTIAAKKRAQQVYSFQTDPDVQVFCAGMKAIRLGHNLDAASAVVLNGLDFDYETLDQFIKRVRRLTSKQPIDVYVILPMLTGQETITSRKWGLLNMKGSAVELALDGRLLVKAEAEVSEADMIRELQERGLTITDDAVEESEIERAWELMPHMDDFEDWAEFIPERPEKPEEEPDPEVGDQLALGQEPVVVPDELVEERNAAEFDAIDRAEAELEVELAEMGVIAEFEPVGDELDEDTLRELDPELTEMFPDGGPENPNELVDPTDGEEVADATSEIESPLPDFTMFGGDNTGLEAAEALGAFLAALWPTGPAEGSAGGDDDPPAVVAVEGVIEGPDAVEPLADTPEAPAPAPALDPMSQLKQAKELHDIGVLTEEEYAAVKKSMLAALGVGS